MAVNQLIKRNVLHRVVATIPCPKIKFVNGRGGRYERISQLNMVALGILAKIVSGPLANLEIDGDAIDGFE